MKDIQNYTGLYAITEDGRVWSYRNNKFLKPTPNSGGYLTVGLNRNGNRKTYYVHKLVAEAFIPNPDNLTEVNHISEVKTDNRVENLEWISRKDNNNYGTRTERTAAAHRKAVYCVELDLVFESQTEATKALNLPKSGISNVLNGRQKTTKGYHFIAV